MREIRNITVAVTPELYRQTRKLAADYDSTVTAIVAYLLERLPKALKNSRYPVGGPKSAPSASPAQSASPSSASSTTPPPSQEKFAISACTAVNPHLNPSLSKSCEATPETNTAPVPQYATPNQHI
jgi:hypothetical protein